MWLFSSIFLVPGRTLVKVRLDSFSLFFFFFFFFFYIYSSSSYSIFFFNHPSLFFLIPLFHPPPLLLLSLFFSLLLIFTFSSGAVCSYASFSFFAWILLLLLLLGFLFVGRIYLSHLWAPLVSPRTAKNPQRIWKKESPSCFTLSEKCHFLFILFCLVFLNRGSAKESSRNPGYRKIFIYSPF